MKPQVVLIVDDDNDDRDFLKEAICEYDNKIVFQECKNGAEAVATLSDERTAVPDFIFLDLNMPLMNGRQCLRKIREMGRFTETPVIIYSTSKRQDTEDELKSMGAVHYLTKPSRLTELRSYVRNILNRNWHLIDHL